MTRSLKARRVRNICALLLLAVSAVIAIYLQSTSLRDTARFSGWCLMGLVVFLSLYNLKKKLAFLPIGSSSLWLQMHIYLGLFSGVVFLLHMDWEFPSGSFDTVLAELFLLVFFSGVLGLAISRSFAKRMTIRGDEVIYERIPVLRRQIQNEVERLAMEGLTSHGTSTIANFYRDRLLVFLKSSRNFWQHLAHSTKAIHDLLNAIEEQKRFLSDADKEILKQIALLTKQKDNLDYHFALQSTLKYWLFIHVPLTYALLVFVAFHLLLVHTFSGGSSS